MNKTKLLAIFPLLLLMAFQMADLSDVAIPADWQYESSVAEVLAALGDQSPVHQFDYTEEMVQQGEAIVKEGRTPLAIGAKSRYVSKFYVCTSCHNVEREDPDLRFSDPETRLNYVKQKGLPFLQGTTFKGIVNRETWYNDDYVKKYGDEKIEIAHHDLRESIQLCAIECSQGRPMEDWEINAVLAYYWSLEFRLDDLDLSKRDLQKLNADKNDSAKHPQLLKWLKSFYLQKSPAHFYDAAPNKRKGYQGLIGDPDKGKDVYDLSCLYCHQDGGVSHYILDNSKLSFRDLRRMIPKNSHFSLYQIIPYGTYAIPGHRPYMPHYPLERMSKQQVENLRAYVEQAAD